MVLQLWESRSSPTLIKRAFRYGTPFLIIMIPWRIRPRHGVALLCPEHSGNYWPPRSRFAGQALRPLPPVGGENLLCYRNFLPFQGRCHEVVVGFYTQNRTILRRLHSSEFCKGSLRLLRWARNDPPVYQNPGRCIKRNPINYTVIARSPALRGDEAIPSILYILYIVYTGK